jgi:hypothetical protein
MARVQYRDTVPYETPTSLSALRGPDTGALDLPTAVFWGPSHRFDLAETGQRRMAYRALVREGTPVIQEALLNKTLLLREWPNLILPSRCQALWEERFPELRQPDGEPGATVVR